MNANKPGKIIIVTAYYDIGRGDWPVFPRSKETYLERFKWLCTLDNPIIAYVDPSMRDELDLIRKEIKPDLRVICHDAIASNIALLRRIHAIQQREDFKACIPTPHCPEYWSPEYVLINNLKSSFCLHAVNTFKITNRHVAWIDFGYVRDPMLLPHSRSWQYDFGPKINLFPRKPPPPRVNYADIIKQNIVYIHGAHIVAPAIKWQDLNRLVRSNFSTLLDFNLVDDDQSILLMAYHSSPDSFELRLKPDGSSHELFGIFKEFNRCP